jgi:hypothetical protein
MIFDLKKPIYGSFFGIWNKWLKIAKERDLNMVVNTPFGTATFKYRDYMKGAKRLKRFYKNPNEPMIFYARSLLDDITKRTKRKKIEKKLNQEFTTEGRMKLLEAWKKLKSSSNNVPSLNTP